MKIRRATAAAARDLAAVYRNAYRENRRLGFPASAGSVTAETVAGWIEDCRVYVATIEEEIVGGVRLEVTDPDRVKLSRFGVHEDRKGAGIGIDSSNASRNSFESGVTRRCG